jgi:hypothetical protein
MLAAMLLYLAGWAMMFLAYCLLIVLVLYAFMSAVGIDGFRKDVISLVKLLFEKGYSADQVCEILEFYCSS